MPLRHEVDEARFASRIANGVLYPRWPMDEPV